MPAAGKYYEKNFKSILKAFVCCILIVSLCVNFAACSLFSPTTETTYTIQYTDDYGVHIIEVKYGDMYSMEYIPNRIGYTFLGLYDAEVGGTQYVNSNGSCLTVFTDNKNLILYPQYKANEYILILDYGEAEVTGNSQYTVTYDESLPELPTNLTVEHRVFSGWYTEENCGGTKVADSSGLIPDVSVLNCNNFEITSRTTYIYLYAGFTIETHEVTFIYGSDIDFEIMEIEYGTNVTDIVTTARNSNGFAVLSWSLTENGSVYTGIISGDMTLYAIEWAPCINFESYSGDCILAIVAREGTEITLPEPTKPLFEFVYWVDLEGNKCEFTVMPAESITLFAIWRALVVIDENYQYIL